MNRPLSLFAAFIMLITLSGGCLSNKAIIIKNTVKINDIVINPGRYNNEMVTISGVATQYTEGTTTTTSFYILQDDFGGILQVNTGLVPPKTMKKYFVKGTIVIDQAIRRPILIEKSRMATIDIWVYILIGVIAILFVLILFIIIQRYRKEPESKIAGNSNNKQNDPKTVLIDSDDPPTVISIPGTLKVIHGHDAGKSYPIIGYPLSGGVIVTTIGRETITGDRKHAHIYRKETTVSHKQAEIQYYPKKEKVYILNLSASNNTQVNGYALKVDEKAELSDGAIIKMGEVEFKYSV